MTTDNILWLFVIVGGPLLLAGAFIYGMRRNRKLTAPEKNAQDARVRDLYDKDR
ncbi:LPXTG cell wall anchor domain-containing protein [Methylobrevis pamukkalensis]|uniref:Uncharacterized protein n=1 Tax=Methylobrevis pamukkalensis TaxID=1439726 RepID=A0A1E3H2U5_9HYPH|nr:LPXTG cell wall anchor domain-containing protein [Methylobrevis pamukkalensis]ODN70604.1 hypothetical protein A6302_02092 [Methylobrevis pamukkalensis]